MSSTQRSSLWKRMGRRGSKSQTMIPSTSTLPGAAIPLKSVRGDASIEKDTGDARSIPGKILERRNGKSNGKGSGIIRKLKSPFQKTPAKSSSDANQSMHGAGDGDVGMNMERKRHGPSSRPNSPAYSVNSFATIEVSRRLTNNPSLVCRNTFYNRCFRIQILINITFFVLPITNGMTV